MRPRIPKSSGNKVITSTPKFHRIPVINRMIHLPELVVGNKYSVEGVMLRVSNTNITNNCDRCYLNRGKYLNMKCMNKTKNCIDTYLIRC